MKKAFFILWTLVIWGCDKNEPSPASKSEIFKAFVSKDYDSKNSGDWLLVHDPDGKLIYSSLYESGDTLVVTSEDASIEKVSITLFKSTFESFRKFDLTSYTDVSVGQQWILGRPVEQFKLQPSFGTYTLTAYDIPFNTTLKESTQFGVSTSFEPQPSVPDSYKGKFTHFQNAAHLVYAREANDNLRYKFFDNVMPNQDLSFRYSDLISPESVVSVDTQGARSISLSVFGFDAKPNSEGYGYNVGSYYWDNKPLSIKVGYVNRLKAYYTRLMLDYIDYSHVYEKLGPASQRIWFSKKPEATFLNMTAINFSFEMNGSYQRRSSQWAYKPIGSPVEIINWTVHSPSGSQRLTEFPPEFSRIFPTFEVSRLKHTNTQVFLTGTTYEELIKTKFQDQALPLEYERVSVILW